MISTKEILPHLAPPRVTEKVNREALKVYLIIQLHCFIKSLDKLSQGPILGSSFWNTTSEMVSDNNLQVTLSTELLVMSILLNITNHFHFEAKKNKYWNVFLRWFGASPWNIVSSVWEHKFIRTGGFRKDRKVLLPSFWKEWSPC